MCYTIALLPGSTILRWLGRSPRFLPIQDKLYSYDAHTVVVEDTQITCSSEIVSICGVASSPLNDGGERGSP